MRSKTKGFNLTELLVVVAIVAIIAAILFPVLAKAKGRAKQASCTSNLRQVYLAFSLYTEDHGGAITGPPETLVPLLAYAKNSAIFQCPEDKRNRKRPDGTYNAVLIDIHSNMGASPSKISYGYVHDYEPGSLPHQWRKVATSTDVGIVACPWHGSISANAIQSPALEDLVGREGPYLRVCGDGHLFTLVKPQNPQYITTWDLFYSPRSFKSVFGEDL